MKRIYTWIAMLLITAAALSCSKTSDPQPATNNPTNTNDTNFYFMAKIDGTDWSAEMKATTTSISSPPPGFPQYTGITYYSYLRCIPHQLVQLQWC